jgi:hypothetical protein
MYILTNKFLTIALRTVMIVKRKKNNINETVNEKKRARLSALFALMMIVDYFIDFQTCSIYFFCIFLASISHGKSKYF